MKKLFIVSLMVLALVTMYLSTGESSAASPEKYGGVKFVRAGASAPTSISSFAFGTWARFFSSNIPEIKFNTLSGASKSNIRGVEKGILEWGYTGSSDYIDALKGGEAWGGEPPIKHVVYLFHQFSMGTGWFIRGDSKIKSMEDLKSKNIGLGRKDYSSTAACLAVLNAYGITPDNIGKTGGSISYLDWSAGADALSDGRIDCQVFPDTSHGRQPALEYIEQMRGVKVLQPSLEKLNAIAAQSPFSVMKVEAQRNYKLIKEPYNTLCVDIISICRDNLPDDLVYEMLKIVFSEETVTEFQKVAPSEKNCCLENGLCSWRPGWPIHPAAARFYKEQGVTGNKAEVFWDDAVKKYYVAKKP